MWANVADASDGSNIGACAITLYKEARKEGLYMMKTAEDRNLKTG